MSVIHFDSVTKIYRVGFLARKVTGVKNLSFSIHQGSITGFVGPNGAGKTTSIKLLLGLIRPDSGTITINGVPAANPASRKKVAYLSEQPHLYEHLTAGESLALTCRILGGNLDIHGEIKRVLDEVNLVDAEKKKVKALSKGMQQRLGMAMALLGNPDVFILDEPMSGMDPPGRRHFRHIFQNLRKNGKTILFSTHSLEDVTLLCTDILVVSRGELVYNGSVAEILNKGYEGTELVISDVSAEQEQQLKNRGITITDSLDNAKMLLVSDQQDLQKCQQWLFENKITIQSVTPRSKSLESILYDNNSFSRGPL